MNTECPKCHQQYAIDASLVGKRVECEVCNYKWEVLDPQKRLVEASKQLEKVKKGCVAECFIRGSIIVLGVTLMGLGFFLPEGWGFNLPTDSEFNLLRTLLLIFGFIIFLCAFVTFEKKVKTFYFICPNPNCGFKGNVEYEPDKETLKNVAGLLVLQAIGFNTIIYSSHSVACPRCGMLVKHSGR